MKKQRLHLLLIITLFVFTIPSESFARKYTIVVFGDSLTSNNNVTDGERFDDQLEERLNNDGYDALVINESIWGIATGRAKDRFEDAIRHKPDLIIIQLGANDMFRKVAPNIVMNNLKFMIERSRDSGAEVLLAGMKASPSYGLAYASKFNDIYSDLEDDMDVLLYPFILKDIFRKAELNSQDMIHPNEKGIAVMVNNITPYVREILDDLDE